MGVLKGGKEAPKNPKRRLSRGPEIEREKGQVTASHNHLDWHSQYVVNNTYNTGAGKGIFTYDHVCGMRVMRRISCESEVLRSLNLMHY
jgi:hypothetical protein